MYIYELSVFSQFRNFKKIQCIHLNTPICSTKEKSCEESCISHGINAKSKSTSFIGAKTHIGQPRFCFSGGQRYLEGFNQWAQGGGVE